MEGLITGGQGGDELEMRSLVACCSPKLSYVHCIITKLFAINMAGDAEPSVFACPQQQRGLCVGQGVSLPLHSSHFGKSDCPAFC